MSNYPTHDSEITFAVKVLNSLFQAQKRLGRIEGTDSVDRALDAIKHEFRSGYHRPGSGFEMVDPTGQKYSETRSDVQATMSGVSNKNLRIIETMKPIISLQITTDDGRVTSIIVQQGIVVVRSSDETDQ